MKKTKAFELPAHLTGHHRRAVRLEYFTLAYMISVIVLLYLTMGTSQAMKTAWIEDLLTLLPPISFLIASKIAIRPPNRKFPYGYHRINSIAFLIASVALFGMGVFLICDNLSALLLEKRPTINTLVVRGHQFWMGWVMILVMIYSAIGPVILGYLKLPISIKLHNKVLYTDAKTNKADYLTAAAACLGITGIGFGLWWADAVAALLIATDIVYDGFRQMGMAITDLMNRTPKKVDHPQKFDPLTLKVQEYFQHLDWVNTAQVRFREEGQVYFGEVFVVPEATATDLLQKARLATDEAHALNWRIFDLTVSLVEDIREDFIEEIP